jgi:recombination protein RecT
MRQLYYKRKIEMTTPTKTIVLSEYIRQPDTLAKFANILGNRESQAYVQSVLIAVSNSDELMKCTPQSVVRSALRAASLGLSCDPALKQAWLVPYNKKIKTPQGDKWIKEAQFQPHYKGLYTLAMRTGKYWQINVSAVYEGQRVLENTLTGLHAVREENGLAGKPDSFNAAYTDVTVRRRANLKTIGWIGYFKTKKGFEKSVWMSSAEIDDHARKYVRDYEKNPNWNDVEKRPVMEMKTVLRQLLSWADMSGTENAQLVEAMQADEPESIDVIAEDVPVPVEIHEMTIEEARETIVKTRIGDVLLGNLADVKPLNEIYLDENTPDNHQRAVALILKHDFQAEPPEQPKRTREQNMKELGFE